MYKSVKILLVGSSGGGKTILCYHFLEALKSNIQSDSSIAKSKFYVSNGSFNSDEDENTCGISSETNDNNENMLFTESSSFTYCENISNSNEYASGNSKKTCDHSSNSTDDSEELLSAENAYIAEANDLKLTSETPFCVSSEPFNSCNDENTRTISSQTNDIYKNIIMTEISSSTLCGNISNSNDYDSSVSIITSDKEKTGNSSNCLDTCAEKTSNYVKAETNYFKRISNSIFFVSNDSCRITSQTKDNTLENMLIGGCSSLTKCKKRSNSNDSVSSISSKTGDSEENCGKANRVETLSAENTSFQIDEILKSKDLNINNFSDISEKNASNKSLIQISKTNKTNEKPNEKSFQRNFSHYKTESLVSLQNKLSNTDKENMHATDKKLNCNELFKNSSTPQLNCNNIRRHRAGKINTQRRASKKLNNMRKYFTMDLPFVKLFKKKQKIISENNSTVSPDNTTWEITLETFPNIPRAIGTNFEKDRLEIPTNYEIFVADTKINGEMVRLILYETGGSEDNDKMRPYFYPNVNVILLCFSTTSKQNLMDIKNKWIRDIRKYYRGVKLLLIGTKTDQRDRLKTDGSFGFVTTEDGNEMAKEINALEYNECTVKDSESFKKVFRNAIVRTLHDYKFNIDEIY